MSLIEFSQHLPPCSPCGGRLVTSAIMPNDGGQGRPIHLKLCAACDGDQPAAAALLGWFASGAAHDPARVQEGAHLLEWVKEGMAAHGWDWVDNPGDAPAPSNSTSQADVLLPASHACKLSVTPCARLATAGPQELETLKTSIRENGEALAQALLTPTPQRRTCGCGHRAQLPDR